MLVSPTGLDQPISQQPSAAPSVEVTSAEVLISTQQVVFGTAIALGAGRRKSIAGRLVAIARRILTTPTDASVPQRRHYPKHYGFLENALMAREMERL
jgi:hypothetical protein